MTDDRERIERAIGILARRAIHDGDMSTGQVEYELLELFNPLLAQLAEAERQREAFRASVEAWGERVEPKVDALIFRALAAESALSDAQAQLRQALTLATEATNGWACYAKRAIEHDDIARLHKAIYVLRAALAGGDPIPPTDDKA